MQDQIFTLQFKNQESKIFQIQAGILQGFSIFLILFLYYNLELIKACNLSYQYIIGLGFINNTNILAYKRSTYKTTRTLSKLYQKYIEQATKYKASFSSKKYSLIYFFCCTRRFNLSQALQLEETIIQFCKSIRILGLYLNI